MNIETVSITLLLVALLVLGLVAPKLASWIVIVVGFVGIVVASTYANGFPEGFVGGIFVGGIIAFVIWLRFQRNFAETARARAQIENKNFTCENCGQRLAYHRTPKKFSQVLFGGLTCEHCGAEYDVPLEAFRP